ncbi:MAG: tryptophan synthase subunit alpha [Actinobacteria bacterium]|nr:MAG: tryptophan synthase subunit alpha [Actinomycetota bacterium]
MPSPGCSRLAQASLTSSASRGEATRIWPRRSLCSAKKAGPNREPSGADAVSGVERISEAFASARADGRRAALMPYLMGGFPDLNTSFEIARACVDAGGSLLELGIPFSDPLADGPVIQAAGTTALNAGVTLEDVLGLAGRLSHDGVPVVIMCYENQILARGVERFADMLQAAGVSGLIVPDLPLEEADATVAACDECDVALVPLVAPTTPDERLEQIASRARGFLYVVSLTGTTGADGVIVGSRLVRAAEEAMDPPAAV